MTGQLWWHLARASGFSAWALATAATIWGLLLSTKLLGAKPRSAWLLDLHRYLGGLAVILTLLHVAALVADNYVRFTLADVLVPFASSWRRGPVTWGVCAAWLLLAVELTSLAKRRLPASLWRSVHQVSFPLYFLLTAHALTAGTDSANPVVLWSALLGGVAVTFLVSVRLLSAHAPSSRLGAVR
jgi:DMSO/TMAO reductase YedYZ heme-binding membrane subunit